MSISFKKELETLIRARYPIIYIHTYEEERAESIIQQIAKEREKRAYSWSVTRGLYITGTSVQSKSSEGDATRDPVVALNTVLESVEPAIFIFKDFHFFINDPVVIRKVREISQYIKNSFKTLILVSPIVKIPPELDKEITLIELGLPSYSDLDNLLTEMVKELNKKSDIQINLEPIVKERLIKAALGLTLNEAENVFAKILVMRKKLGEEEISIILEEKKQIIQKSGILEYYPAREKFSHIGGLEVLKEWLKKRRLAFTEKAKKFGLPPPKGVLLIGVQGCGKSLCAKAAADLWKMPLLRLDMGKVFSSLVGSSEENIRRAIQVAESVAPAILWVDEIEKAFSGVQSSSFSDAGTTARVFGAFLTWLQEKTSPVFVIATANNIQQLPPELLRKGRFDEIFFVDLPTANERKSIFYIHLVKRGRDPRKFNLDELVRYSEGFSGAEIEEAIVSALFDVFERGEDLTTEAIKKALKETVPLSRTMKEEIDSLRRWAQGRARKASLVDEEGKRVLQRKIEL